MSATVDKARMQIPLPNPVAVMPTLHVAEPPDQYRLRPTLVVDCSALAGILFREAWQEQKRRRFEGRSLHAPHLLQAEISSVAIKTLGCGETHAADGLTMLSEMAIDLYRIEPQAVMALAMQCLLSAYDATYLWLAAELKSPLATFDNKLAAAAKIHLAGLA